MRHILSLVWSTCVCNRGSLTTAAENTVDPYCSHNFQSTEHLIDNSNMHMTSIHPFSPYLFISGNQPFMSHAVTLLWFVQHTLATNHTSDGFFLVNKKKIPCLSHHHFILDVWEEPWMQKVVKQICKSPLVTYYTFCHVKWHSTKSLMHTSGNDWFGQLAIFCHSSFLFKLRDLAICWF